MIILLASLLTVVVVPRPKKSHKGVKIEIQDGEVEYYIDRYDPNRNPAKRL